MFKTKAIILRTVKYGETSLVVTAFTEMFGIQTYMLNGVRSAKKAGLKAAMYQPAAILDLEVYHNDKSSMHRIRECSWSKIFNSVLSDVVKNSIALYMIELLHKLLKQPEENSELFYFCEDALLQLDDATKKVAANFPLFFTLHLSHFFGFKIDDNYSAENEWLDLMEGNFTAVPPSHNYFLHAENAAVTSELLKIMIPAELEELSMNHLKRRELLAKYIEYYSLHIQDFGQMKTLTVMREVLE